jgi:hypothetical protein
LAEVGDSKGSGRINWRSDPSSYMSSLYSLPLTFVILDIWLLMIQSPLVDMIQGRKSNDASEISDEV